MRERSAERQPIRLWPGVVAAAALALMMLVALLVLPAEIGLLGAALSTAGILVWWLLFSRATWFERIGAFVLMLFAVVMTRPFIDRSIVTGAMGGLMFLLATPLMSLALVGWAAGTRRLSDRTRRVSLPGAMFLACGFLVLLRTNGVGGREIFDLQWRWTPTAEDRLLADTASDPIPPAAATTAEPLNPPSGTVPADSTLPPPRSAEWPGFRGPERDGVVHGLRIDSDWSKSPPVELWRRKVGPGWSSFAVGGDLFYTQEQRGPDEIVACYRLSTGQPVWGHRDAVRFWESNAGAGPRGTPTLSGGRLYALGATGILNVLDAQTGALVWSRNTASDTGMAAPEWGFSSSPLVTNEVVIVAMGGKLAGYDIATGKPRWIGENNGFSYSSPHLVTIDGVEQAVLLSGNATGVAPADGTVLWQHTWEGGAIVQPALIGSDILINSITFTGGSGIRRLAVGRRPEGWNVEKRWTTTGLKPYFNDFVVHRGHAFGFDGSILAAIDLADGSRKWKGGRYGSGQLLLLAEQDLLLVLSEEGELILVSATPESFVEVARAPAIEGKTWNHPVLAGEVLLVRNGEEMAAFRLSTVRP